MNFFRFLNTGPDVMLNLTDHVEASRSCWSILIMLVLTDHAGAYWSCWILLIILVLTDQAGANRSCWSKLIILELTDHAEANWSCWSLLIMLNVSDHAWAYWSIPPEKKLGMQSRRHSTPSTKYSSLQLRMPLAIGPNWKVFIII